MHTIVQHVKSCPLCFQFLWQRSKNTSPILEDHYLFLSVFNDSSMLTKIRMESPRPLQKDDIDLCLHCQSLSAPDGFPANWVAHCAAPRFDSSSQQPPVAEYLGTWLNKKYTIQAHWWVEDIFKEFLTFCDDQIDSWYMKNHWFQKKCLISDILDST